jgi:hypothetical protein
MTSSLKYVQLHQPATDNVPFIIARQEKVRCLKCQFGKTVIIVNILDPGIRRDDDKGINQMFLM